MPTTYNDSFTMVWKIEFIKTKKKEQRECGVEPWDDNHQYVLVLTFFQFSFLLNIIS